MAEEDNTQQIGIFSELKIQKSLPTRIFSPNLNTNSIDTAPRSCSANGTCSTYMPFTIGRTKETRAAFEDSSVGNESDDKPYPQFTDHVSQEDHRNTTTTVIKDDTSVEGEAAPWTPPAITREDPGNEPQAVLSGPMHNDLFTTRSAGERAQYAPRDKRKSLIPVEVNSYEESQSTDETELGMVRSQIHNEMTDTQKDTVGAFRDTRLDEENTMLRKEGQMSQDETLNRNKETENTRVEVSYNAQDKTEGNSEEHSDTIQPLALPHSVQLGARRRRSSTASVTRFPGMSPSDEPDPSRSRRVSIGGAPNFLTPSTSGQTDTTQGMLEAAMKLQTQSSAGKSDPDGTRRGSQSRRSSVAASMLNCDVRDGKKGSIGFTLAASLVKWKINTLKVAKKANETIAKNAKHQEFMDRTADRIKTELPRPLLVSIQEEAYPIILRTAQAYRSQLGAKHKLTVQACDRLADLIKDMKSPY